MRTHVSRSPRARWLAGAIAVVLAGATAACGSDSGPAQTGDGVPAGATIEQYKAAFADIEAIELNVQVPVPPESPFARASTEYTKALAEWSDGKIVPNLSYASAVVPYAEMSSAMADGLMDMGDHAPQTDPATFPFLNAASQLMLFQDTSPVVGTLQLVASWVEFGASSQELREEYAEAGLVPLVPTIPSGSGTMVCTTPVTSLASLKGKLMRGAGSSVSKEIAGLGATPVSLPNNEVFDGMQRGTLDCSVSSLTSLVNNGIFEVGKYWTLHNNALFTAGPSAFAMSKAKWDSLPLVAKQLIWDRLDVFLENYLVGNIIGLVKQGFEQVERYGVEIVDADADIAQAMADYREGLLAELARGDIGGAPGQEIIDRVRQIHEKWLTTVTGLGYDPSIEWRDYGDWLKANDIDGAAWVAEVRKNALDPNRPS